MNDADRMLLNVWREVGRHLEIQQSTQTIAKIVAGDCPLAALLVRRFDATGRELETVACSTVTGCISQGEVHTSLTAVEWKRIQAWFRQGEWLHSSDAPRTDLCRSLVPKELTGPLEVGPLSTEQGPLGLLIAIPQRGSSFASARTIIESLREPFAAALENDRRLQELATLREAAEADRRTLLAKLGREDTRETVVGADSGLKLVMERVELVARSDLPILILGETGTGKEVVSRAIHRRSSRSEGPFIRVNCGAIPSELIDSQLFGHEKGSFTGAADQHQGWFERANGGTLFLDEMGELPLPAQVRLLRVLQDHQIERIGGRQSIHVDVRIVAATHRDLASMVKAGSFREDLWYRINVFPILLPRLKERTEDIPPLVRHFAQRSALRFGVAYVEPSPTEIRLLMNYHWPGNIRELGAVIDRAVILGNGKSLDVATALGLSQPISPPGPPQNEPTFYEVVPESLPVLQPQNRPKDPERLLTLDLAMKNHIEQALIATQGRIEGKSGAARLLGINPHTLRARMRKLEIPWADFRKE